MFRSELKKYYPIECTMTVHTDSINDAERRARRVRTADPDQKYYDQTFKVALWMKEAPPDFTGFR